MSWPPKPADLTEDAVEIPDNITKFLSKLLTGNMEPPKLCSEKVQRLVNSFGQGLVFGLTCGPVKTPKHILLPHAVKSLTTNVQLIQIINRCGMMACPTRRLKKSILNSVFISWLQRQKLNSTSREH